MPFYPEICAILLHTVTCQKSGADLGQFLAVSFLIKDLALQGGSEGINPRKIF